MKIYGNSVRVILLSLLALVWSGCSEYPMDDDGLLITDREECDMTSFDLLGSDHRTVFVKAPVIDNEALTVTGTVKYGTNLAKLKPRCGHSIDALITPKMGAWTDFSNLDAPLKYTVVSGNRQVRKTYSIILTVQAKPQ